MPTPETSAEPVRVVIASEATLPTEHGDFRVYVFSNNRDDKEHVAMVHGDVFGVHDVVTRVHSECLTGDIMSSLRCDCRGQLDFALRHVASLPQGIVLYMRQEGRGIGLTNKIRAYSLQEQGLDTVEANQALGFADDQRDYGVAAAMLRALRVRSIRLLTNNPDKVRKLTAEGIMVRQRLPIQMPINPHNRRYIATKVARSGHLIELPADSTGATA